MIQYTEKKGIITRVGDLRTSFPGGKPVTITFKKNGFDTTVPGVSVGVQFDFEPNEWYSGILFPKQAEALRVGTDINVKTWEKESNGKTYKNFALIMPKKADMAEVESKINPLITTVERQGKQIMSHEADLHYIKDWITRHDTTTMFDDDAPMVHPREARALNGGQLPSITQKVYPSQTYSGNDTPQLYQEQPPVSAYNEEESYGDINPEDIPF